MTLSRGDLPPEHREAFTDDQLAALAALLDRPEADAGTGGNESDGGGDRPERGERTDGRVDAATTLTRRGTLAGGAAVLAGGLLGSDATGRASAAGDPDAEDVGSPDEPVDVFAEEVHANRLHNGLPATATTGAAQPRGYSQYQDWSVASKTPLLSAADLSWTTRDVYWPWVLKADEVLSNPLDTYYLYFSEDHTSGGVGLATFSEPGGPVTDRGKVFDAHAGQDETPAVVWDDRAGELKMTYHSTDLGTFQSTGVATSTDGVNWTDEGLLLDAPAEYPGNSHTGYFRPFRHGERWVGYHLMGGGDYPRFAYSTSTDFQNWHTSAPLVNDVETLGGDDRRIEWNATNVVAYNGTYYWVGVVSPQTSGADGGGKEVYAAPFLSPRRIAPPTRVFGETETWESGGVYNPYWFVHESTAYVAYTTNGGLALAELDGGVY
ncbi:hypothetical protein ACFO0N_16440 [Halobium salinum]|uniref:Glycosyl hydrolase family 32 N-terminal domain-containing protein n=1 Tax=Halobium salinum TaxID=1364940 RepID=A0ABD5PFS3_9EURY|nr:hypothetical protein [Halobium salinum]